MEKKATVLVDIDDTLGATQKEMLTYINERSSRFYAFDELTLAMREGQDAEYQKLVDEFLLSDSLVSNAEPFENALEAMAELHRAGFAIHIASARKENLHTVTLNWLERHGFADYIERVHGRMQHEKSVAFKVAAAKAANAVAAFDDTWDVAEALSQSVETVFLIDKPWNRTVELPANVHRQNSFVEAVETFLQTVELSKVN